MDINNSAWKCKVCGNIMNPFTYVCPTCLSSSDKITVSNRTDTYNDDKETDRRYHAPWR